MCIRDRFNISTASAIVVASYGIPVAKHGNRAASGNSGSADVLEELGIKISLEPKVVEKCLHEIDLTFIFAQTFHPSMKYAAGIISETELIFENEINKDQAIPIIYNAENVSMKLKNGDVVTLVMNEGVIYKGQRNISNEKN